MSSPIPSAELALETKNLTHQYQSLVAINDLSLRIESKQIFGILGPNGSGKSTLFRLASTLTRVQSGDVRVAGFCVKTETEMVRKSIGVVFQSPSLDRKLTVLENIRCQAALYGLSGPDLQSRIDELTDRMGLQDKLHVRCEKLSGGQKRRVELTKGLLHRPSVLFLDEPSTGLDPAARLDLWNALVQLRDNYGTTVILTTHLLEEADKCDRIAILNEGKLVACNAPEQLRSETGETVITISTNTPESIHSILENRFSLKPAIFDQQVRVLAPNALQLLPAIMEATIAIATSITVGRPSLEDVFITKTGHKFHRS